jgi:hypothetical protein
MTKGSGRKQTSDRVSSIAGKYVGGNSPLGDVADRIATACRDCGVPLNDRAVLALTNRLEAAIAPVLDDLRTLAASCLSQDETPPNTITNAIVERERAQAAAERNVLQLLARLNPPKQFSKRSIALMSNSRGALIADMGSR